MDYNAIEALFERNADMRLLELRHNDIGSLPTAVRRGAVSFNPESMLATTYEDLAINDAPRLRVTLAAVPAAGVIPGAVVAVAVDVFNDGAAPAPESRLVLALPHDCRYRLGSLRVDGREVLAGELLFGAGLSLARIPGASSTKVTFAVVVLPGIAPLHLQPQLHAGGVPVVGAPALAVKRAVAGPPAAAPARPFYELEEDETGDDLGSQAAPELPLAPSPPRLAPAAAIAAEPHAVTPPDAQAPPDVQTPANVPAPREDTPKTVIAGASHRAPETPWPKINRPPDVPVEAVPEPGVEDRMPRYRTLAAADLAVLERLMATPAPGIAGHGALISALACYEAASADESAAFAALLRRQTEAAARTLVLARLGKTPPDPLLHADLSALAFAWEPAAGRPGPPTGTFRLRRDLRRNEYAAVAGLLQPSERAAALRLRVALAALGGASIEGRTEPAKRDAATVALTEYRSLVLAWLVPLCMAPAGTDAPAGATPPAALDAAGRRLIAALRDVTG